MEKEKKDLIEKNRKRAEKLIEMYMKELSSPEKLADASINQIASALGTLVEKFGKKKETDDGSPIIVTHCVPRGEDKG